MSYGDLERCQERMQYWHGEYNKANKRAEAAIAEAKKSKERELTAIRMMLKLKPLEKAIEEIAKAESESDSYQEFGDKVIWILRGLGYECV